MSYNVAEESSIAALPSEYRLDTLPKWVLPLDSLSADWDTAIKVPAILPTLLEPSLTNHGAASQEYASGAALSRPVYAGTLRTRPVLLIPISLATQEQANALWGEVEARFQLKDDLDRLVVTYGGAVLPGPAVAFVLERMDAGFDELMREMNSSKSEGSGFLALAPPPGLSHPSQNLWFRVVVAMQMVDAVALLHENSLTHGALQPCEFLWKAGKCKLFSLGAVTLQHRVALTALYADSSRLPQHHSMCVAPELNGARLDAETSTLSQAADVYALGVLLHFVLGACVTGWGTGKAGVPVALPNLAGFPPSVVHVLEKSQNTDPRGRPTVDIIRAVLQAALPVSRETAMEGDTSEGSRSSDGGGANTVTGLKSGGDVCVSEDPVAVSHFSPHIHDAHRAPGSFLEHYISSLPEHSSGSPLENYSGSYDSSAGGFSRGQAARHGDRSASSPPALSARDELLLCLRALATDGLASAEIEKICHVAASAVASAGVESSVDGNEVAEACVAALVANGHEATVASLSVDILHARTVQMKSIREDTASTQSHRAALSDVQALLVPVSQAVAAHASGGDLTSKYAAFLVVAVTNSEVVEVVAVEPAVSQTIAVLLEACRQRHPIDPVPVSHLFRALNALFATGECWSPRFDPLVPVLQVCLALEAFAEFRKVVLTGVKLLRNVAQHQPAVQPLVGALAVPTIGRLLEAYPQDDDICVSLAATLQSITMTGEPATAAVVSCSPVLTYVVRALETAAAMDKAVAHCIGIVRNTSVSAPFRAPLAATGLPAILAVLYARLGPTDAALNDLCAALQNMSIEASTHGAYVSAGIPELCVTMLRGMAPGLEAATTNLGTLRNLTIGADTRGCIGEIIAPHMAELLDKHMESALAVENLLGCYHNALIDPQFHPTAIPLLPMSQILHALERHEGDVGVQRLAWGALRNVSASKAAVDVIMGGPVAFAPILAAALRKPDLSPAMQDNLAGVFQNLTTFPTYHRVILDAGCLQPLRPILSQRGLSVDALTYALGVYRNLSVWDEGRDSVVAAAVLPLVVRGCQPYLTWPHVMEHVCAVIQNSSIGGLGHAAAAQPDVLAVLKHCIEYTEWPDARIPQYALGALRNITAADPYRRHVSEAGIVPSVVYRMVCSLSLPEVLENGCAVLQNVTIAPALRAAAVHDGMVSAIVAAMECNSESASMMQYALGALRNLSANAPLCSAVIEGGILSVLPSILDVFVDSEKLVENACAVIQNLCIDDATSRLVGQSAVVRRITPAMRAHRLSPSVTEFACGSIRNMSRQPDIIPILVGCDATVGLKDALNCHPAAEAIVAHVVIALANFSAVADANVRGELMDAHLVPLLQAARAAHHGNALIAAQAASCIARLA